MAVDRVRANSRNILPTMPPISRIGRKTAIREMLIENTVKPTSRTPTRAASKRLIPCSRWRVMFSSTTMASSTTKPVETVRAISDRLSREKPSRYITPRVPSRETVTATAGTRLAAPERRKTATTATTRMTAISRLRSTSAREARMEVVRSTTVSIWISAGMAAATCGRICLMPSTVLMMFAPAWAVTKTTTDWLPSLPPADCAVVKRPRLWISSTLSTTSPTSCSRTAAPLR